MSQGVPPPPLDPWVSQNAIGKLLTGPLLPAPVLSRTISPMLRSDAEEEQDASELEPPVQKQTTAKSQSARYDATSTWAASFLTKTTLALKPGAHLKEMTVFDAYLETQSDKVPEVDGILRTPAHRCYDFRTEADTGNAVMTQVLDPVFDLGRTLKWLPKDLSEWGIDKHPASQLELIPESLAQPYAREIMAKGITKSGRDTYIKIDSLIVATARVPAGATFTKMRARSAKAEANVVLYLDDGDIWTDIDPMRQPIDKESGCLFAQKALVAVEFKAYNTINTEAMNWVIEQSKKTEGILKFQNIYDIAGLEDEIGAIELRMLDEEKAAEKSKATQDKNERAKRADSAIKLDIAVDEQHSDPTEPKDMTDSQLDALEKSMKELKVTPKQSEADLSRQKKRDQELRELKARAKTRHGAISLYRQVIRSLVSYRITRVYLTDYIHTMRVDLQNIKTLIGEAELTCTWIADSELRMVLAAEYWSACQRLKLDLLTAQTNYMNDLSINERKKLRAKKTKAKTDQAQSAAAAKTNPRNPRKTVRIVEHSASQPGEVDDDKAYSGQPAAISGVSALSGGDSSENVQNSDESTVQSRGTN